TDALGESAAHLESYVRVILGHTGTGASTGSAQATVVSAFAWTRTEEADPTAPDRRLPVAAAGGDGRRGTRRGTFAAPGSHGRQTRFAAGHGELTAHVTVGVGDLEFLAGVLLVGRVHLREGDRGVRAQLVILDSQIAQPLLRQLTVADGLVEVLLRIAAGQGALLDGAAGGLDVLLLRARRTDLDRGRALRARDLGVDLLRADRRRLTGGRGVGLDLGSGTEAAGQQRRRGRGPCHRHGGQGRHRP